MGHGHRRGVALLSQTTAPPNRGGTASHYAFAAFSADGQTLAVAWLDGGAYWWETATGKERAHFSDAQDLPFAGIAFSADGRLLALLNKDGRVRLWNVVNAKLLTTFQVDYDWPNYDGNRFAVPSALAFSVDGKALVVAVMEMQRYMAAALSCTVYCWEVASHKERGRFRIQPSAGRGPNRMGPDANVMGVSLASDMRSVLLRTSYSLRRWDLLAKEEISQAEVQPPYSRVFAFSPDGSILALGGEDGAIYLWEVVTGKQLLRLEGHRGKVSALAFSWDGETLLSGAADTTVLVWDMAPLHAAELKRSDKSPAKKLEDLWADLASEDPTKAYEAVCALVQAAKNSPRFLGKRLQSVPRRNGSQIPQLIGQLDSDRFEVRQRATEELEEFGNLAEPALQQLLAGKTSAEVRRRAEGLLKKLGGPVTSPERLRAIRAVEVLEHIGTPEAKGVLETLVRGTPGTELAENAKAAVERLAKRSAAGGGAGDK